MIDQGLKIYNLPNDFSTDEELGQQVMIRSYQSPVQSLRNKSIINWNMIDIILMGRKTIIDISGMPSLETGELMVLSKGSCLISQALPANGLFKSLVIYFTNGFLADFLTKYRHLTNTKKGMDTTPFLKYTQDDFITNYISSLQQLLKCNQKFTPEFKLLKTEEILLYLAVLQPGKLQSLSVIARDNGDMELRRAVERMLDTKATVEELAFLCNTSLSSFKRRFFNIYGMSPKKWIIRQKIQLAANLLTHPDECAGSVYAKVGYETQASFTKAFKQYHGLTPRAYQLKNLDF